MQGLKYLKLTFGSMLSEAVAQRGSIKKAVLKKFVKIRKIHRKTPVSESLFKNICDSYLCVLHDYNLLND